MTLHEDDPAGEVREVLPDARLLFVLVVVLLLGAFALVSRWGGGDDGSSQVTIGRLEDVLLAMTSDPLPIPELPGIVVTRGAIDPFAVDPTWGEATGSLALRRDEALFALDLADPIDGTTLTWCRSSGRFEHAGGSRTYGVDGRLRSGNGRRGMDRRAISAGTGGQVVIDPSRWVAGVPVSRDDAVMPPVGTCLPG